MPPVIDQEKCTGCGTCVDVCSEDVYFGSEEGATPLVSYPEVCFHCNCCVQECPTEAIRLRIPLPQMLLFKKEG
jgi:adenylylsulfate reductase, subunit B